MYLSYLGIFLPQKSMDQLLVPIDSNIPHPHITMKYYGSENIRSIAKHDLDKIGVHTTVDPWALITSPDIDVIVCRRTHQGMSDMPHITVRVSNGAKTVDSNKFMKAYRGLHKARVFDPYLTSAAQLEAMTYFKLKHPEARIFKYGTIKPLEAQWGAFGTAGLIHRMPESKAELV